MDASTPKFTFISLFPGLIKNATSYGVLGRAIDNSVVAVEMLNPRDFSDDARGTIDEPSYGGGPGMVMQVAPIRKAIAHAQQARPANEVIYLSPQGEKVTHRDIQIMAESNHTIFLCGRYEGIDQRVIDHDISRELSVGDFVMSGGEFAALCILDAVTRLIPGALGNDESAASDSFHADLLDHPHYTRPEIYDGQSVPEVLLSGDHAAIRRWRRKMALGNTFIKRPDLLAELSLSAEDESLLADFRAELVKSRS